MDIQGITILLAFQTFTCVNVFHEKRGGQIGSALDSW